MYWIPTSLLMPWVLNQHIYADFFVVLPLWINNWEYKQGNITSYIQDLILKLHSLTIILLYFSQGAISIHMWLNAQ